MRRRENPYALKAEPNVAVCRMFPRLLLNITSTAWRRLGQSSDSSIPLCSHIARPCFTTGLYRFEYMSHIRYAKQQFELLSIQLNRFARQQTFSHLRKLVCARVVLMKARRDKYLFNTCFHLEHDPSMILTKQRDRLFLWLALVPTHLKAFLQLESYTFLVQLETATVSPAFKQKLWDCAGGNGLVGGLSLLRDSRREIKFLSRPINQLSLFRAQVREQRRAGVLARNSCASNTAKTLPP